MDQIPISKDPSGQRCLGRATSTKFEKLGAILIFPPLMQTSGLGIFPQLEEKPAQVEPGCRVKWFFL